MPKWPFPTSEKDGRVVSEAESIVKAVQRQYQQDVERLTQEVVGKSGRPFMQVPLSVEERRAAYDEMRQADDPKVWAKQLALVKNSPRALKRLIKQWSDHEAEWREAQNQGVVANFPGATLPQPPTETPPDAGQPVPGSPETSLGQ